MKFGECVYTVLKMPHIHRDTSELKPYHKCVKVPDGRWFRLLYEGKISSTWKPLSL